MINLTLSLLLAVAAGESVAAQTNHFAVAKRFVDAIQNNKEFQPTDFWVTPSERSQQTLRKLQTCRVTNASVPLAYGSDSAGKSVPVQDQVTVEFKCRGVSEYTPVGATLHFRDEKIRSIELHNFDLMKSTNG